MPCYAHALPPYAHDDNARPREPKPLKAKGGAQSAPLFNGLRVRMTIHTDLPDAVTRHQITQKLLYQGSVYDVCESLTEFAKGGQVALSAGTYGRLTQNARAYMGVKAALAGALARTKQSFDRKQNAVLTVRDRVAKCGPAALCCAVLCEWSRC